MTETLHHWTQRIEAGGSPAYLMIAELIAEDVETDGSRRATAFRRCVNSRPC